MKSALLGILVALSWTATAVGTDAVWIGGLTEELYHGEPIIVGWTFEAPEAAANEKVDICIDLDLSSFLLTGDAAMHRNRTGCIVKTSMSGATGGGTLNVIGQGWRNSAHFLEFSSKDRSVRLSISALREGKEVARHEAYLLVQRPRSAEGIRLLKIWTEHRGSGFIIDPVGTVREVGESEYLPMLELHDYLRYASNVPDFGNLESIQNRHISSHLRRVDRELCFLRAIASANAEDCSEDLARLTQVVRLARLELQAEPCE